MRKLSDLVEIRSGYTFRSAVDSFPEGDTEVIQAKDIGQLFDIVQLPKIAFPGEDKHLLKPGDILLSARGLAKAQLFHQKDIKAVASSSIFVLTPKNASVSPEFITMYFNSSQGMRAVFGLSSGSSVKSITKESLGNISVPEIPPDKEQALGKAVQAIDDYRTLMTVKEIYLNDMRETIINKILKESTK